MRKAFRIDIQLGGCWHASIFSVEGDPRRVTVTGEYGSKTTLLGDLPAALLARRLLFELVTEKLSESDAATTSAPALGADSVAVPGNAAESDIASGQDCENESEGTTPGPGWAPTPDPVWPAQRWPGESAREFRAYCFYRNLTEGRSLQKAWRENCKSQRGGGGKRGRPRHGGDVVTKCPGAWTALSRRYEWLKRADAYDRLRDQECRAAKERFRALQEFNSADLFEPD
jgi:hypothetical protein